jgi:hypothetical protein
MDSLERYNPLKRNNDRKMKPMKLIWLGALLAGGLIGLTTNATPAPSPWEKPAAEMAGQIAGMLGPGQAQLTIRNLSTIPNKEIPAIQRLLEQDLKTLGVLVSGAESANIVHMILSENQRERLWVAEVIEGNETRVAMVEIEKGIARNEQDNVGMILRKQSVFISKAPVLALMEKTGWLAVVEPDELLLYYHSDSDGWKESNRLGFPQNQAVGKDPQGLIEPVMVSNEGRFEAFIGGIKCNGHFGISDPSGQWTAWCDVSDDPWPIAQEDTASGSTTIKAFYNAARNYFTGVISPSLGVDLPPFYTAVLPPHPSEGAALLVGGIDGKVQVLENGSLQPVSGARDWGSDFAALHSGCGAGTQIIASGSGEATKDSLRAYELPAHEAIPASAALAMDGTVTALWTAPDGKSIFAVVRSATNEFEVDRVTASCN